MRFPKSGWLVLGLAAAMLLMAGLYVALFTGGGDNGEGQKRQPPPVRADTPQENGLSSPGETPEQPAPKARKKVPSYLKNLPRPVPDIVAMIKAQKPVTVDKEIKAEDGPVKEEYETIRRRLRMGDRKEAARLFELLADKHPGTPVAAMALFEMARSPSDWYEEKRLKAAELETMGKAAMRLAEEYPAHPLTVRALHMYVTESLRNFRLLRTAPAEDDWQRVFRGASVLSGRYTHDPRGPECLLALAVVLQRSPEARPGAMEICRLVSQWPDTWDSRFYAYRLLHDDALERGDLSKARQIALKAARQCAGRVFRRPWWAGHLYWGKRDAPWQEVAENGIPSEGKVLLEAPKWAGGKTLTFKTEGSRNDFCAVYLLREAIDGLFAAVVSSFYSTGPDPKKDLWRSDALVFLGSPEVHGPYPTKMAFLPRFPVREGVEIVPFDGIGLVRQEARMEDGKVAVRMLAGRKTVWQQTWRKGEPWWDKAKLEYESRSWGGSWCPGPYDVDPDWQMGMFRIEAERIEPPAELSLPSAEEVEKRAIKRISRYAQSLDEDLATLIHRRLPDLFSGKELEQLQATWKRRIDWDKPRKGPTADEAVEAVKTLLAGNDAQAALKKLDELSHLIHGELFAELKAEALLANGDAQMAADILKWLPRRGPEASAKARLLEARAWRKCSNNELALLAALELLRDQPDSPEAAQAKAIADRLKPEHGEKLRKYLKDNPYMLFRLRSYWPEGAVPIDQVHLKPSKEGGRILIWDGYCWRCCLTPDGAEVELPRGLKPLKNREKDHHGTASVEFARKGDTVYVREADRIAARNTKGKEIWRYQVAAKPNKELHWNDRMGLPYLANPHLIHCPEGDRIVCGVGQRTVFFGMGVSYSPVGGSLLALDLNGKKIWEKEAGHCEALTIVPRKDKAPVAVGLFAGTTGILAGFDTSTGETLWEEEFSHNEIRFRGQETRLLFTAKFGKDSHRIIFSHNGDVRIMTSRGKKVAQLEGFQVEAVADFDSDGTDEILLSTGKRGDYWGKPWIVDLNGKTLWRINTGSWRVCGAADLDNDGWLEIVAEKGGIAVFGRLPLDY